jgi:hypothetical protein
MLSMYLVMNDDSDPVSQLETLLGPRPSHPWAALIPQILLWSFRRFCIAKLCKTSDASLTEQIWDNHTELIDLYAPKGLEVAAAIWITPENIDLVHSSLEDYNYFFLEVLAMIDGALVHEDADAEDMMATFLDTKMSEIIYDWVENKDFLIFPMANDDDDVFSDEQYMKLLVNLTEFAKNSTEVESKELLEDPPEVRIEVYGEIYSEPEPVPESIPTTLMPTTRMPPTLIPLPAVNMYTTLIPLIPLMPKTVKAAFNYRRTFKNRSTPRRITKKRMFA